MPNLANPGLFNRFAYVSNNPLKFTDPTGYLHHCEAFVEFGTCDGLDEFGLVNSAVKSPVTSTAAILGFMWY